LNLDTVLQGLAITVVGMGLVFLALGLLVLAMQLMGRYLRPRSAPEEVAPGPEPETEERARVAAMAAAFVLAGDRDAHPAVDACRSARGAGTPSPWQASHRTEMLDRRPGRPEEGGTHL
jgi:sodium pump decarboxylase gamma subunit